MTSPLKALDFDKIFCVNLLRRPDRRAHAVEQFKRIGLDVEFYEAIDASELRIGFPNGNLTAGMIGCYLSHFMILKQAVHEGWNRLLIFEDDLTFMSGFNGLMLEAIKHLPDDWQFAYLGYTVYKDHIGKNKPVNAYWQIPGPCWGTQAFMINGKDVIGKIYEGLKTIKNQVDVQLTYNVLPDAEIKVYGILPSAVMQSGFKSDVQPKRYV